MKKFYSGIQSRSLNDAAHEWLISCLDPYHDNQMRMEGLPDMITAPSVVKMHNYTHTLTAPASAATDWDASIAFTGCNTVFGRLPTLASRPTIHEDLYGQTYDHAVYEAGNPFGTFTIKAGASAAPLIFGTPLVAGDTNVAYAGSDVSSIGDRCRIIGVALEVHNTTAEIYKQGSLTVAMLPSAVTDFGTARFSDNNVGPYREYTVQSWLGPEFAATRAALSEVPGVATWPAKDGVYIIPRLWTHTMSCEDPLTSRRAVVCSDSAAQTKYHITAPSATGFVGGFNTPAFAGVSQTGFIPCQVFFSGLSHETSLTITMRTIVEYFPSFGSQVLPLARPSTSFCPEAFELYASIAKIAPYAVPVKQNGGGEYFRRLLRIAAEVGGHLAPMAGVYAPAVAGLARGGMALSRMLDQRAEKAKQKKKSSDFSKTEAPRNTIARREAGARAIPTRR